MQNSTIGAWCEVGEPATQPAELPEGAQPVVLPASDDLGLSNTHISPLVDREGGQCVELSVGGGLVRLRGMGAGRAGGGKRGKVGGFSRAARRRLLEFLASLNREALAFLPLFLTLTYPGEFTLDPAVWKRDLDVFLKRVRRAYPDAAVVWKLEPQKRGAPHYHLLVFGVEHIPKSWLRQAWYEVVGSGDEKHLWAGTRVERVKSWRGVMAYAAKYLGKVETVLDWPEYVGRWWGVSGRGLLPIQFYTEHLGRGAFYAFRRVLYQYLKRRGVEMRKRARSGVTVFLDADVGFDLLHLFRGA